MDNSSCTGAVFGDMPLAIKLIGVFNSVVLGCASIMALFDSDIVFSALYAFCSCGMVLLVKKLIPLYSSKYVCENDRIYNIGKFHNSEVDTRSSIFLSQTRLDGTAKTPSMGSYYILSNNPISYVPNHQGHGVRIIQSKTLVDQGVVILPINQNTALVINRLAHNIAIPVYPKIAYVPK